jgi:hypothetical protein
LKQRNFTKCSIRVVVILFAFPLFNCVRNRLSSPASRADFLPDSTYLEFGRVYEVEVPQVFSQKNPHQVVQYSVYMCRGGLTDRLLQEITHVEEDTALGNAFVSFVRDFGPALELFKDSSLWLRFEAYADYEDVSVWYYYLVDSTGNCLARNPWVSLHRSRSNGKCALTGIFVNLPDEELMDIPGGLRKK